MSGSSVTNKAVRPRTKYSSGGEESCAEQEWNGLEEGEDAMTDEEGEGVDGEGEARSVDWRVRVGPRNKPTAREREEHEATHMPFRDWCTHCLIGRGRTDHHVSKQKSENSSRRSIIAENNTRFLVKFSAMSSEFTLVTILTSQIFFNFL